MFDMICMFDSTYPTFAFYLVMVRDRSLTICDKK